MQAVSRIVAFALAGSLLILSASGADDENKKTNPPKEEGKKTDVKKDEPAKKDANKDEPAKKEDPAKNDADKKDSGKKMPGTKLPPRKGKLKYLETDKDAAEKKALRKTTLTGEVMAVVEDKKSLRLKLTIPYVRVNEGQLQNYLKAQNLQQMLQAQAQLYELATTQKQVELMAADDYKVRMRNPPPQFDDKGRPKRYTKKELQELKGNDKLPFFPAEFSDIKAGQIVEVTLLQNKSGPRPIKRGKDIDADAAADNLPKMSMIIILGDPKN
jgi:competence protein ComGC